MRRAILGIFVLLPCFAQQSDGVITGTVSGEDRNPVPGAYVTLHLLFKAVQDVRQPFQTQWGVYSGPGGSFRFTGLRSGTYRICVQAPTTAWLDPCEWGLTIPSVALTSAVPSQVVAISLTKGVEVPIRIEDPGQLLLRNESSTPGAHLLVGVRTAASTFRPAVVTGHEATVKMLKVVIPFDKSVNLTVASSFFKLADGNGAPFSKPSISIPVSVAAGRTPATVRISIAGGN